MALGRYHWSNCAPTARFFKINALASVPWLALILHPAWITALLAIAVTGILIYIELIRKMTLLAFFRSINIWMTGRVKPTSNFLKELNQ